MNTSEKVLNGIKQALTEGKATVKLSKEKAEQDVNEASQLTGSGLNKGGRTYFDDAFAALRLANPFRGWAREVTFTGSAAQFVAKAKKEISWNENALNADILFELRQWLKKNIHVQGKRYLPGKLCEKVTGQKLDKVYFEQYLLQKFTT